MIFWEVVALAEHLAHDADDLLGMVVILGEDEGLGNLGAAGEQVGEQGVAEGLEHGPDLFRRRHGAIFILRRGRLLLPSPLWGGVGGGGRASGHFRSQYARPPTPTLPQPKLRIRRFRPINRVIEIGNSRFRLGGGRRDGRATCYYAALLANAGAERIDLVADIDAVGDRALVRVLRDEVVAEKAERVRRRRGGEPDDEGIEIGEHLLPGA